MTGRSAPHVVEVDQSGLRWIKSSASSSGENSDCVEVAFASDAVLVRDSRDRSGPRLIIPLRNWIEFVAP